MDENNRPSKFEKYKSHAKLAAAFTAGAATTAAVIRYRNGIGFNTLIRVMPLEDMRAMVTDGSKHIFTNEAGQKFFIEKISRIAK